MNIDHNNLEKRDEFRNIPIVRKIDLDHPEHTKEDKYNDNFRNFFVASNTSSVVGGAHVFKVGNRKFIYFNNQFTEI